MTLASLAISVALVTVAMLSVASLVLIGRDRLVVLRAQYPSRLLSVWPHLALLATVLLANSVTRRVGPELSWVIGWNITGVIYAIEGSVVAVIQSAVPSVLLPFFSFMYIYGYVFLLVFPLLAYVSLADVRPLQETCLAYTINYALGLVIYVLFISYGPRNLTPDMVESLLYVNWPESQFLVSQVNTNTNVFPSLHTSLSATVALLSYRTRRAYPWWTVVAFFFAGSVIVSTMYLGIHWFIDVLAGIGLAGLSVSLAIRFDDRTLGQFLPDGEY